VVINLPVISRHFDVTVLSFSTIEVSSYLGNTELKDSIVFQVNHGMERRKKKLICCNELNVFEFISVSYIIYIFCKDNVSRL
jgi:hypothetical protein